MTDSAEITVKIVKDFKGTVTVRADGVLGDLLQAIEGAGLPASQVANFIIRGKRVDASASADAPLASLGVANNSTVMLVRRTEGEIAAARAMAAQEERARRLADVEAAAKLLTQREGGVGNYELSLTDQNGRPISMPTVDRKSLSLAYLLHAKGRAQLDNATQTVPPPGAAAAASQSTEEERAALSEALHYLEEGERALALCDRKWLALGDNAALLHLDCAWAALLHHAHGGGGAGAGGGGDVLSKQRERLEQARQLLSALHGAELQRLSEKPDASHLRAPWVRLQARRAHIRLATRHAIRRASARNSKPLSDGTASLLCCSFSKAWSRTTPANSTTRARSSEKRRRYDGSSCSTAPKTTPSWRASLIWGLGRTRPRRRCWRARRTCSARRRTRWRSARRQSG